MHDATTMNNCAMDEMLKSTSALVSGRRLRDDGNQLGSRVEELRGHVKNGDERKNKY